MNFILIILAFGSSAGGPAVTSFEVSNKALCEQAANVARRELGAGRRTYEIVTACVPKKEA